MLAVMRVVIHVKPGSARAGVGGAYGDALVVRVVERAVDGRATEAALRAVAAAVGVPARDVTLVSGATSRSKVVEIAGAGDAVAARLAELLGGRDRGR